MNTFQRLDLTPGWPKDHGQMPAKIEPGKDLQGRSAFTNRMMRFRLDNGLVSWSPREGSEVIRDIMLRHLTQEQLAANSTKGYKGLTKEEKDRINAGNAASGRFNSRAGTRSKRKLKVRLFAVFSSPNGLLKRQNSHFWSTSYSRVMSQSLTATWERNCWLRIDNQAGEDDMDLDEESLMESEDVEEDFVESAYAPIGAEDFSISESGAGDAAWYNDFEPRQTP